MRKALAILILILGFFITYFLQVNFFSWFTISGVKPNLFIVFILFISLFCGMKVGIPLGVCFGLFLDMVIGKKLGTNAIMLGAIALIGGYFDKNFSKDSRITIMFMIIASTLVFEVGYYILQTIELSIHIEIVPFLITLLIEVIYNAIMTIILYPLIQKMGYKLEDIFKGQIILTKYF